MDPRGRRARVRAECGSPRPRPRSLSAMAGEVIGSALAAVAHL
jgi:hypothetical protein